jgi:hypothetical protein
MRHTGHDTLRSPDHPIDDFLRSIARYVRATTFGVPRLIVDIAGNVRLDVDTTDTVAELAARIERSLPPHASYLEHELARIIAVRDASLTLNTLVREALIHYACAGDTDLEKMELACSRLLRENAA